MHTDIEDLPEEVRIEPPRGPVAWYRLAVPVAGVLAGVLLLGIVLPPETFLRTLKFLGIYMVPGGIDFGPPVGVGLLGLSPTAVVGLIAYFDIWITLFWIWNLDHLGRFERVEARIEKSRARAHAVWQRLPWLKVATVPGLALFIMLPIPWTGSFTGIVIGKLIELPDPLIFVASLSGTTLRVALLAFGVGLFV